ncbi:MAG: hypothetical protein JXB23_04325 [Candidatus Aminicenantes bacterium]|nr:hypothetical protein [Candidatus Aminicenantes bacterium]
MKRNRIDSKETVRLLTEFLQNRKEIVFAYLHGSFVGEGDFRDIDIAVFLENSPVPSGCAGSRRLLRDSRRIGFRRQEGLSDPQRGYSGHQRISRCYQSYHLLNEEVDLEPHSSICGSLPPN